MIILRIGGGIGNQLFEFAFGYAVSKINNYALKLSTEGFKAGNFITPRTFGLDQFQIPFTLASADEIHNLLYRKRYPKLIQSIYKRIIPKHKQWVVYESGFDFNPVYLKIPDNRYVVGVWHSFKYFEMFEPDIRAMFQLKEVSRLHQSPFYQQILACEHPVCVHIRRGDYVSVPMYKSTHGLCSDAYYLKAQQFVESKLKNPHYFIFSDDIDYVRKKYINKLNTTLIEHSNLNDCENLMLMASCKHHIIANSSYSW